MALLKKHLKKYLWYLIFIPLPMILLLISQWDLSIRGPYYERQNYDPEYQYLLSGLKIINGQSPNHVDHPGTTLQLFSAVVIEARNTIRDFLVGRTSATQDVLQNPEAYLYTIRDIMAIGIALLLFLISVQIYTKTKLIWAAIGYQLFPFLSTSMIHSMARVSPEPFLVITVLLGTILLIKINDRKQPVYPLVQPILMGLFLGVGLVTKLTFLPFLLLVFWFPLWRDRMIVLITFICSFLIFTIPVWSRINYFVGWVTGLVTRQQSYGSGPQGLFPPFQTIIQNLKDLAGVEPFYFIFFVLLILYCIFIWKNRTPETRLERLRALLLLGILAIELIMVMKYGGSHYMVPGLTLLGFVFLVMILKMRSIFSDGSNNFKVIRATLLILLFGSAVLNTFIFFSTSRSIVAAHSETEEINTFLQTNYANCTIIPYYGASSQTYALLFANGWAGDFFADSLSKIYPNTVGYNVWSHAFYSFSGENKDKETQDRLARGECILLRGRLQDPSPSTDSVPKYAQLSLEDIIVKNYERVYRIKAIIPQTP